MLRIDDLCVSYGGIEAVKGISFKVEEGQIVTLIGANGAPTVPANPPPCGLWPAW